MTSVGLVVVAAGASTRMGAIDKVWADLGGEPVVVHALAALAPLAATTVLVVRAEHIHRARETLLPRFPSLRIAQGGAERQDSVRAGLALLHDVQAIAIHDAARPLVPPSLLECGLEVLRTSIGAVPVESVRDTIKLVSDDGVVERTLERRRLRAVQTPQVFRAPELQEAYRHLGRSTDTGTVFTDDAWLMEANGYRVQTFPGSHRNFKITSPLDLALARLLLAQ